jgi:hypothetical protein
MEMENTKIKVSKTTENVDLEPTCGLFDRVPSGLFECLMDWIATAYWNTHSTVYSSKSDTPLHHYIRKRAFVWLNLPTLSELQISSENLHANVDEKQRLNDYCVDSIEFFRGQVVSFFMMRYLLCSVCKRFNTFFDTYKYDRYIFFPFLSNKWTNNAFRLLKNLHYGISSKFVNMEFFQIQKPLLVQTKSWTLLKKTTKCVDKTNLVELDSVISNAKYLICSNMDDGEKNSVDFCLNEGNKNLVYLEGEDRFITYPFAFLSDRKETGLKKNINLKTLVVKNKIVNTKFRYVDVVPKSLENLVLYKIPSRNLITLEGLDIHNLHIACQGFDKIVFPTLCAKRFFHGTLSAYILDIDNFEIDLTNLAFKSGSLFIANRHYGHIQPDQVIFDFERSLERYGSCSLTIASDTMINFDKLVSLLSKLKKNCSLTIIAELRGDDFEPVTISQVERMCSDFQSAIPNLICLIDGPDESNVSIDFRLASDSESIEEATP